MLIDSHHHLWRYNPRDYDWISDAMRSLRRDFLAEELAKLAFANGVDGTLVVQARQTLEETNWLLDIASSHPLIQGVVGWVPLFAPDLGPVLEKVASHPKLRGLRHMLQDEADHRFMLSGEFNRGIGLLKDHDLVYDILVYARHLPQTVEFVDMHPQQVFVVDHIAKPRIREGLLSPWTEMIRELARRENVYCKISGLLTEADWQGWNVDQLRPYFDAVLSSFGPRRLMFGSDWPVLTLACDYGKWVQTFQSLIADLSLEEQERISCGTVREAYRL